MPKPTDTIIAITCVVLAIVINRFVGETLGFIVYLLAAAVILTLAVRNFRRPQPQD